MLSRRELESQNAQLDAALTQTEAALQQATLRADENWHHLSNMVRLVFNTKAAIEPLIGEALIGPEPTTDYQGVIFTGQNIQVIVNPSTGQVIVQGIGTNIRRGFLAECGMLASNQVEKILATVQRIQRVQAGMDDPFVQVLDLTGTPVEPDQPALQG